MPYRIISKQLKNLALVITTCLAAAMSVSADDTPEATIIGLFDAMRSGDGGGARARVVDGAMLDRALQKGALHNGSFPKWAGWIDTLTEGQADEQIFDVEVKQFGNLANVWAPFMIYLDGELKGCGVNQFALAKIEGDWKITYGMDTHDGPACEDFRERYAAQKASQLGEAGTDNLER